MGCRSFLTPDRSGNGWNNVANAQNYVPGKPKYYGRFNQGVVTINLPDVACPPAVSRINFGKFLMSAWNCATAPCSTAITALKGVPCPMRHPFCGSTALWPRLKKGRAH